ncbi:MAG: 50S ribosomal protein L4 [Candidatus Sungbacteria bacterium]|nr:50S ribosomal protein L4 [Candidatus Sungbacteria bacterium]
MKIKVYNQEGKEAGTADLPDGVFGLKWNADLVHQVVTGQAANLRRGTAHAKGRSEVRGGGRKPWRQKGTGRARHGSIRSPIWIGGGVTHGPLKEKSYHKKINKKMAKKALFTALSAKARDNEIVILEDLKFSEAKTRYAAEIFRNLSQVDALKDIVKAKTLLAFPEKSHDLKRAFRNLPRVGMDEARNLNAHEVLQYRYILMSKAVLGIFKQ